MDPATRTLPRSEDLVDDLVERRLGRALNQPCALGDDDCGYNQDQGLDDRTERRGQRQFLYSPSDEGGDDQNDKREYENGHGR